MPDLNVRFHLLDEEVINRRFVHLEHVPDDFRPAFEKMAEDFWAHEAEIFASEGSGWRPLAPSTIRDRVKHGFGPAPIMVRTGRLMNSLISDTAPDSVYNVFPDRLELGTENPYAIYHQTGSIKVVDHPPKRELANVPTTLRMQWMARIHDYLHDEVGYGGES